ncbi:MAG: hypothetical protein QOJ67_3014 [Acidimicrobiaceae bacterium]|jgi:hypothetical protein
MSVLWVLPVMVVAIGLVAVFAATRQAAFAAADLRTGCTELLAVRTAIIALADDTAATRAAVEDMRGRSFRSDEAR